MVTDRTRGAVSPDALIDRVAGAARAGVNLIQIRERDLDGAALLALVRRAVDAVRGTATRIIVNERLDVALAAAAHGVHLRGDSMPASRVTKIVPSGFLIGRSVHTLDEAVAATRESGADYLAFGTVFRTRSKEGREPAGPAALAQVVSATALPVLAIGGVTAERVRETGSVGAAGFAAIGLFADAPVDALDAIVHEARAAFTGPEGEG